MADKYGLTTGYTGGFGVKLGNVFVEAGATLLNTGSSTLEIQQLSGYGTVASNGVYLTGLVVAASAEDGPSAVPEPSTLMLLGIGLLGLGLISRRAKYCLA